MKKHKMQASYNLNGKIFLSRENGDRITLSYAECIEIFAALGDVLKIKNRDEIIEELENLAEVTI